MTRAWCKRMLLMAALGCAAFPALAQEESVQNPAQEHCLVGAQRAYDAMRLSDAIRLLEDCKSRGWPELDRDARIEALRFLALSYVEQGMMDVARESVRLLLQEDRRYQAPPDDPGVFRNWVEALRPKAWYQKRWVQISSVAVVGGVLGFVLTGPGKEGPAPLPPPVLAPPSN